MATTTPRRHHADDTTDRDKRAALQLAVRASRRANTAEATKANAVRFALDKGVSLRELADALGVSHMTVKRIAERMFCSRCEKATTAEDPTFTEWEAADETGNTVICPDCITSEERQAMDEDDVAIADAVGEVEQ